MDGRRAGLGWMDVIQPASQPGFDKGRSFGGPEKTLSGETTGTAFNYSIKFYKIRILTHLTVNEVGPAQNLVLIKRHWCGFIVFTFFPSCPVSEFSGPELKHKENFIYLHFKSNIRSCLFTSINLTTIAPITLTTAQINIINCKYKIILYILFAIDHSPEWNLPNNLYID